MKLTGLKAVTATLVVTACVALTASAADYTFTTPTGQTVALSSLKGNVVVLLFSGVQDPQRRDGLKLLASLSERYQDKNVKVFWVSINSPAQASDEQLKSISTTVPILRDNNQAAFKRLSGKSSQLPTIVVLDPQGNPAGQPRGGMNPGSDFINDLASVIDGLLQR